MRTGLASLLSVVSALLLACAVAPKHPPVDRMPERASAYSHPEPDPTLRGTPQQQAIATSGVDNVVVKVASEPYGGVRVVEFVSPDLTPAAKADLRRAYGECVWATGISPPGPAAEVWTWTQGVSWVTLPTAVPPASWTPAAPAR